MTRKDYVLLAQHLNRAYRQAVADDLDSNAGDNWEWGFRFGIVEAIARVADALGADNPNFDRDRFGAAAMNTGVER